MLNKNKTEDNFFTACKVSLSFSDLEERKKKKKIRNNQDQTEVFGSFIQEERLLSHLKVN